MDYQAIGLGLVILLVGFSFYQIGSLSNDVEALQGKIDSLNVNGNVVSQPVQAADTVKGSEDAPVTIVEFSDFECPFCASFYRETLPQIQANYIDTGQAKLEYMDFPLPFHSNAQKAAEAAECAGLQGKYWEMHDKLFEDGVVGGSATFKQYADQLGLDNSFDQCLDTGQMATEVMNDMKNGEEMGVTGTPAFFINGRFISGAQPYAVFEQVIEEELASGN